MLYLVFLISSLYLRFSSDRGVAGTKITLSHPFLCSKEVASKSVVNARSALSWSCKRTVLTQEVLRILLNCSSKLPWDITASHVSDMMLRMQYSGYDQKFRAEVVRSALKAYGAIVEKDACGKQPMYRSRGWRSEERKKREKKEAWYKKGGCENVIFLPATPRSELKRRYEEEIKNTRYSIKVDRREL